MEGRRKSGTGRGRGGGGGREGAIGEGRKSSQWRRKNDEKEGEEDDMWVGG